METSESHHSSPPKFALSLNENSRKRTSLHPRPLSLRPPAPRPMSKLPTYRKLLWIVVLVFLVRVAVRWYTGGTDFWVNGYTFFFELAQNIAAGNGIVYDGSPTAFRVPLYSAFLAVVTFGHKVFLPILLSQSLVG